MVTPLDGVVQRLVPLWHVPCSTRQDSQPLAQSSEEGLR